MRERLTRQDGAKTGVPNGARALDGHLTDRGAVHDGANFGDFHGVGCRSILLKIEPRP